MFCCKHWTNGKYKEKCSDRGGGKCCINISRDAVYEECLRIAKKLFSARVVSSEGPEHDMHFVRAIYADLLVNNLGDDSLHTIFCSKVHGNIWVYSFKRLSAIEEVLVR